MHISDECRHLEFRGAEVFKGRRLMNHLINTADVMNEEFCGALCFMEPSCVSYNFVMKSETGKHKCELNNATHKEHEEDLEENLNYVYRGAKVRVSHRRSLYFTGSFFCLRSYVVLDHPYKITFIQGTDGG